MEQGSPGQGSQEQELSVESLAIMLEQKEQQQTRHPSTLETMLGTKQETKPGTKQETKLETKQATMPVTQQAPKL